MGLSHGKRLRQVQVALSLPRVFSGIRVAAVICIGTSTLAAFIGAGELGNPILAGPELEDVRPVLEGAIPAAFFLAALTERPLEGVDRWVLPGHLRSIGLDR